MNDKYAWKEIFFAFKVNQNKIAEFKSFNEVTITQSDENIYQNLQLYNCQSIDDITG